MNIQTIDKNLLSDLHRKAVANERKRMNFDLRTSALDQSQRMLNALEPGTQVPVHRHMETAETTICIEGYLEVVLYAEVSGQDETGGAAHTVADDADNAALAPDARTGGTVLILLADSTPVRLCKALHGLSPFRRGDPRPSCAAGRRTRPHHCRVCGARSRSRRPAPKCV